MLWQFGCTWRRSVVLEVLEDAPGALRVSVESTFRRLRCPRCGFKCHRVHDRRDKKIRDLEVSGRRTLLVWSRRRMVCDNCDSRFLEDHPAFEGALTARLARRLVADARVMTFSAVERRHGVHWHAVRAVVDAWSALVAERRRSRRCAVLLVDETSMRKRHRYVTVIVNGDTGRTLADGPAPQLGCAVSVLGATGPQMVQGRQGRRQRRIAGLQGGHRRPPRPRPPCAGPVPRHQMVRGRAHPGPPRRPAPPAPTASSPPSTPRCSVPGSRCCAEATPSPTPTAPASTSCSTPTPRLKAGWQALQELHGLYTADDYDGALEALGRFCDLYETGELPEYHDTVDTFIAWSDEILNWHCAGRPSNGRIEGINNLLQVLRRTAHGFTNPRNFEARGILVT